MNETNIEQIKNREIMDISVEDIVPNRFQPRLTFDMEALNELANSIKEHGIIQPLVVRRLQDKYEIIAGERRFKASTSIGMKKVPCIVMDLNDNESAEVAVIENIQRKEMTPLEEAKSFKKILDKGYLTQEELAKRMGKSQSSVANKLRLLNLDEVVQDAILEGKISERHARSLLKIDNKQEQRNVLGEIISKRLTVRQTDELIKEKYEKSGDNMVNSNQPLDVSSIISTNVGNTIAETSPSSIFKEPAPISIEPVNENINNLSTPTINIPNSSVQQEVNPQLNILNNMSGTVPNSNEQAVPQNNTNISSTLDIFKYSSTPAQQQNKPDIQSIINPSVFSDDTSIPQRQEIDTIDDISTFKPINSGISVDINEIKNNSEDIIKKEETTTPVSNLLSVDNKPENRFFIDLDIPEDFNKEPIIPPKVKNTIDLFNRQIEDLKLQGVNVRKEESDLGNAYQIIIRIDK